MNSRFLLVASYPDSIIKFRGALIQDLKVSGVEVHVAMPRSAGAEDVAQKLGQMGVETHYYPLQRTGLNPLKDIHTLWSLLRLMRRVGPERVLAYTVKPVVYAGIAAKLARVKDYFALITGLGFAFVERGGVFRRLLRGTLRSLYRSSLSNASAVFFQNPDDKALFCDMGVLNNSTAVHVVNGSGVDLSEYAKAEMPESSHFLMIARLLGDKGVREYVEAARQLSREFDGLTFSLAGWVDENPDSISDEELSQWRRDGVIKYLGRLSDVRPSLRRCSIYVLPSYREGTPRTVLEAMAIGRPIITTDAPGCRETVIEGYNGILVPVRCVDSLREAMKGMILDTPKREVMGANSRKLAESKYDVRRVNETMMENMGVVDV